MLLNLLIRQALVLYLIYFYLPMHSTMEILSYRKSYQFSDPVLFFFKKKIAKLLVMLRLQARACLPVDMTLPHRYR